MGLFVPLLFFRFFVSYKRWPLEDGGKEIAMGLNDSVSADRIHITFFGMRNAGKSSLVNAVTGQELSLVSDIKGTTTDPVKKAMELLPLGAVVIIDTPGIDDEGTLGELRIKKAKQALNFTDIAVLTVDAQKGISNIDMELISSFEAKKIPHIIAYNKSDLLEKFPENTKNTIYVSAKEHKNIYELKEMIAHITKEKSDSKRIVADIIGTDSLVILVTPIDEAAPKGRLILPQQQTLRDILDIHSSAVVCQCEELDNTLKMLSSPPKLVITDSQAFAQVAKIVPREIPLTSFSILFARYKGNLETLVKGAAVLDRLSDGDSILISEGCTHHRQCNDIGTVKIPNLLKKYTGKNLSFSYTSGGEFPENLSAFSLIIHCGGCMLTERQMNYRLNQAINMGVPMTNYGIALAHMNGILKRSIEIFAEISKLL